MEIMGYKCEICNKKAEDENQLRRENWIELNGELQVWLDKPKNKAWIHSVGFEGRPYHFCSTDCLIKALKLKKSI